MHVLVQLGTWEFARPTPGMLNEQGKVKFNCNLGQ